MSDSFFWFVYAPIAILLGVFVSDYAMSHGWSFLRMLALATAVGLAFYAFTTALFTMIGAS